MQRVRLSHGIFEFFSPTDDLVGFLDATSRIEQRRRFVHKTTRTVYIISDKRLLSGTTTTHIMIFLECNQTILIKIVLSRSVSAREKSVFLSLRCSTREKTTFPRRFLQSIPLYVLFFFYISTRPLHTYVE